MRRAPTAIDGRKNTADATESSPEKLDSAVVTMIVNSVHHQYSLRDDRPLKFA